MARYNLALSLDKADPRRKQLCDDAITVLTPYDQPEQSVVVQVELGIAKLNLAKGDYDAADKYFDIVLKNAHSQVPEQYVARYFKIVSDMMAKKFDAAAKERDELVAWQKTHLASDDAVQRRADAAASMCSLTGSLLSCRGTTIWPSIPLMDLMAKRPDLKGIIFEQLMEKLPPQSGT